MTAKELAARLSGRKIMQELSEAETAEAASAGLVVVYGYELKDATYQDALLAGIMLEAMKGDVRAAEFIRDTAGESPVLDIRKAELKLRHEELDFKREQLTGAAASGVKNTRWGSRLRRFIPGAGAARPHTTRIWRASVNAGCGTRTAPPARSRPEPPSMNGRTAI